MNILPDFEELLKLLEKHGVNYLIVGGYAVAFHGYPRFTKDMDLFYSTEKENVHRLQNALIEFGFTSADLPLELFTNSESVISFGFPPSRVDLLNAVDGIKFEDALPNQIRGLYGQVTVPFIGIEDLIKNKTSTQRTKDKGDAEELQKFHDHN